ncbi:endonuclease NucS domain-containing protein [Natronobiforma cellulositropha]|uniref:endonuclease NucS domain-containing protein n=1 Tax=Natronobiforma cellulositropha TaxID=1679076 RepID=UPI0021D58194|nr:endonuclease NucS domain-containing protein [Natronobiforma cellulositropha]
MIFSVDGDEGTLKSIEKEKLSKLGFFERRDLQEWVIQEPRILGEGLLVITSEYANFEETRDRLDILGLDRQGRLVVIELKRDHADRTTDLQAIKYASYCATLTAEDVQKDYREFWNGRGEQSLTPEDVGQRFADFISETLGEDLPLSSDGWADFDLDQKPRILLAAGSFGTEVTAPVMWLIEEYGMDITCTRIEAYEHQNQILINSEQIIPVAEVEEYMTKRRKKQGTQKAVSRRPAAINVLLDRGVLTPGQKVYFHSEQIPDETDREWSKDDEFWRATVTGNTGRSDNVKWDYNDEIYSFTGLTRELLGELLDSDYSGALNGYKFWCHPDFDGRTLSSLRNSATRGEDQERKTNN